MIEFMRFGRFEGYNSSGQDFGSVGFGSHVRHCSGYWGCHVSGEVGVVVVVVAVVRTMGKHINYTVLNRVLNG